MTRPENPYPYDPNRPELRRYADQQVPRTRRRRPARLPGDPHGPRRLVHPGEPFESLHEQTSRKGTRGTIGLFIGGLIALPLALGGALEVGDHFRDSGEHQAAICSGPTVHVKEGQGLVSHDPNADFLEKGYPITIENMPNGAESALVTIKPHGAATSKNTIISAPLKLTQPHTSFTIDVVGRNVAAQHNLPAVVDVDVQLQGLPDSDVCSSLFKVALGKEGSYEEQCNDMPAPDFGAWQHVDRLPVAVPNGMKPGDTTCDIVLGTSGPAPSAVPTP